MRPSYPHLIYVTPSEQEIYLGLARIFGGKARVVEIAIDWAISNNISKENAPPPGRQIHPHLSKNYAARYDAPTIGAFLQAGLSHFTSGYRDGFASRSGLSYWTRDHDSVTVQLIREKAFRERKDPREVTETLWVEAIKSILADTPEPVRTEELEIPTSPQSRAIYAELNARIGRPLDVDTMIDRRIASLARVI